ncbi:multidrug transporter [Pseudomonas sp. RL_15y_Pfl2_60]|uniref:multidrug transporter n=1 Tax=Pseudomonas sp. RL_15y_Pfl2_60 TaxID=3088709 RepID=UPI0030D819E2
MLFGAILILSWFILLIRYPSKALPVTLVAVVGLFIVASVVIWQENREKSHLAELQMRFSYDPQGCPADQPLALSLKNASSKPLLDLQWEMAAFRPGDSVNLVENNYDSPRYTGPGDLLPGSTWESCLPLPPLRSGYRANSLEFRAQRIQGSFAD